MTYPISSALSQISSEAHGINHNFGAMFEAKNMPRLQFTVSGLHFRLHFQVKTQVLTIRLPLPHTPPSLHAFRLGISRILRIACTHKSVHLLVSLSHTRALTIRRSNHESTQLILPCFPCVCI